MPALAENYVVDPAILTIVSTGCATKLQMFKDPVTKPRLHLALELLTVH